MKIVATSDLHGFLPTDIPECDLLLIAGDIVPLKIQDNMPLSEVWFNTSFRKWAEGLPCDKVIFVAGNHDIFCERKSKIMDNLFLKHGKVTYLKNESYQYISPNGEVVNIFGTPYCKIFGNWAFMRRPEILAEKFAAIPEGTDILLTHDAPYGCNDVCREDVWWNNGEHIGNLQLRDAVLEKKPKYVIHGHLHSSNHNIEELGDSKVVCVSYVNEQYLPAYPYFILESL